MSELEFLGALQLELLRHDRLGHVQPPHEAFQASTVEALLSGAFEGDVNLSELLEHGDLGLGTLNGLDGELIVVDGEAWKAELDCSLVRPAPESRSPYAVVVPFSPGPPRPLERSLTREELAASLSREFGLHPRPRAVRVDGVFERMQVRSVPRQRRPYPLLAQAIAHQHVHELGAVEGTMVGFCFPDPLEGIEILGWHLHFVTVDRARGGHVLDYRLGEGAAWLDEVTELHVELPPTVEVHTGPAVDQEALRRLENG